MAGVLPLGRMVTDGPPVAAVFWSLPVTALPDWPRQDIPAWKAEVLALCPPLPPSLKPFTALRPDPRPL